MRAELLRQQNSRIDQLVRSREQLSQALPRQVCPERFMRVCQTAVRQNPELATCSVESLLGSVFQAAQMGLEPNSPLGHCYLIPYKGEVTLQVGYLGWLALVYRTGKVVKVYAEAVAEGDLFRWGRGDMAYIEHEPRVAVRPDGQNLTHAYAVAYMREAVESALPMLVSLGQAGNLAAERIVYRMAALSRVMTKAEVEQRRRAGSGKQPAWRTWYGEMAKKTVLKALCKRLPLESEEVARAIERDDKGLSMRIDPQTGEVGVVQGSQPDPEASGPAREASQVEQHPNLPQGGNRSRLRKLAQGQ